MEIVVGGGEKLYSQNLRDFLRIKEEDLHRNLNASTSSSNGEGRRNSTGLTLSAVLSEKGGHHPPPIDEPPLQRIQSNRTLLDVIREDQTPGLGRADGDGRSSWRHLKDKIRLRRRGTGAAFSSAVPIASSDASLHNHSNRITTMPTRQHSIVFNSNSDSAESTQLSVSAPSSHRSPSRSTDRASFQQTISLALRRSISEENHQGNEEERCRDTAGAAVEEAPARTSLMTLLAENDRQMGFESSAYMEGEEDAVEEEIGGGGASTAATGGGGVEYNSCCVCMVRHKGAAFIPCGHTFCRLCSRELWVQRGNCPLCNNYILEILDIF